MKSYPKASFLILLLFFTGFTLKISKSPLRQWSQYRGPMASGILDNAGIPINWDIKTGENILWETPIPGLGLSCPIVWDDKLFVTTAVGTKDKDGLKPGIYGDIGSVNDESEHEWKVFCLDKHTGEIIWEKVAHKGIPLQRRHPKSTHANCTPASDGRFVVAFFGSEGLYCYDMEGELQWKKDFGVLRSVFFRVESAEWEFASSPIIYDNKVIIQCDVMENSFLAVYDIESGRELWKKQRDEYPGWCTPNIYELNGKPYIVVNGYKHRGAYDLATGEEIWRMAGGGDIPIPTPIVSENLIYFNSAHGPDSPILAIRTTASGEITLDENKTDNKAIAWSLSKGGSYMQTLLLYDGYLYNLGWNGRLSCYHALTGEKIYEEKLGKVESFTASLVASDGLLFAVSEDGKVFIVKGGPEFEIMSVNSLGGVSMVTPAITDGIIYYRVQDGLIAISKKK